MAQAWQSVKGISIHARAQTHPLHYSSAKLTLVKQLASSHHLHVKQLCFSPPLTLHPECAAVIVPMDERVLNWKYRV